tara:strand:+ start:7520 stop:8101 length:582 start_codon:yes stop_codon:yes gene_type:complete
MSKVQQIKSFLMNNSIIEHDFDNIETKYDFDLGRPKEDIAQVDRDYYPQIEQKIRKEAAFMAPHYEVFYSLEKTIKKLISETLYEAEGTDWWESTLINDEIKAKVVDRIQKELDSGLTPRSEEGIDFCTFGELGEIIKENWDLFGFLTSKKAVEKVMASLNSIRGPIAHCGVLADDEVLRLHLSVRDWFRLMD